MWLVGGFLEGGWGAEGEVGMGHGEVGNVPFVILFVPLGFPPLRDLGRRWARGRSVVGHLDDRFEQMELLQRRIMLLLGFRERMECKD